VAYALLKKWKVVWLKFYFSPKNKKGFTLIEVVIAITILVIIIASTMSLLASSYSSLRDSEMRAIAKNIATYTVEYIRSRNVTSDNPLGFDVGKFRTSDDTVAEHYLPGIVDLWDIPLQSNGHPSGKIDSDAMRDHCANTHPAPPGGTYKDYPDAFYYSLQGYVSLGDFDYLSASNPSPEDGNLYICNYSTHHYHCIDNYSRDGNIHAYNHIIMRFPFNSTINNGSDPNPEAIKSFTALPGYIPMIYTADSNKTDKSKPEYSPFYTNESSLRNGTLAYRGFRVLIVIASRARSTSANHVQYYDVKVTVFWHAGKQEHSYTLSSQIATYGGG
jgi:prepilin-type N-terminal cleavage/methylation domain-containing protein